MPKRGRASQTEPTASATQDPAGGPRPILSLVIPVYNSAGYVGSTVTTIVDAFDQLGITGEVVVVDDGSADGTLDAVPDLACVRKVALPHNAGKGAALRAGMRVARGEVRGFTDADHT